jgi:hypothetical protein
MRNRIVSVRFGSYRQSYRGYGAATRPHEWKGSGAPLPIQAGGRGAGKREQIAPPL